MEETFNKSEWSKKYRENNKEKLKEKSQLYEKTEKRKEYMRSENKKQYYKERYQKKKDEIRLKQKEFYNNNKEKFKESRKVFYEKNKQKIIKKNTEYQKNKGKIDLLFRVKRRLRSMISNLLFRKKIPKNTKTSKIIGCEYNEFIIHLENNFQPWMSWDNYGLYNGEFNFGWDIDHIIPISSAKNNEELFKLNHYTNLQPLCSKINRDIKRNIKN